MSELTDQNEIIWTEVKMTIDNLACVLLCVQRRNRSQFNDQQNKFLDSWTESVRIEETKL